MERNLLILQITKRISILENEMQVTDFNSDRFTQISLEIDACREKLQDAMNSQCPIIKG